MSTNKIYLSILVLMVFISAKTVAQYRGKPLTGIIGISKPILDVGQGIYLGINPVLDLNTHLSLEGQLSYNYTKISSGFISGKKGKESSANFLFGGRLYLQSPKKSKRLFLNLLLGGSLLKEDVIDKAEFVLGFTSGLYLEMPKVLIGFSVDTPSYATIKLGYRFGD